MQNSEAHPQSEDDEPIYVQITDVTARIILKILEFERERLTRAELVKKLIADNIDKNITYNFITEAEKDPRQFLIFKKWKQRTKGRPTQILAINPNKIVTNPLSALILIELKEFQTSPEADIHKFLIYFLKEFSYLESVYPNFEKEVNARLAFLKRIGEIDFGEDKREAIWVDFTRYFCILPYLKLLVEKLPKPPSEVIKN